MYRATLAKRKIKKGKYIHNFDESSVRVNYPRNEEIIIPISYKEKYTESPKNRQSLIVMEFILVDGRKPPPSIIIVPGKRIMDNWIHDNLEGNEMIYLSKTRYTNNGLSVA